MIKKLVVLLCALTFTLSYAETYKEDIQDFSEKKDRENIVIDDFFDRWEHFQHTFSPDGKYLAFIDHNQSKYALAITDLTKYEVVEYQPLSSSYPVNLRWVSNRRLLFNMSGKIFAINRDGSDLRILVNNVYDGDKINGYASFKKKYRYWWVVSTLPKDDESILVASTGMSGYENIDRINIFTGEKESVCDGEKLKINDWIVDFDGNIKLGVRRKKGKVEFFKYDGNKLVETSTRNSKYDFNYDGKSYLEQRVLVNGFSYEENKFYITENINGDRFKLSKYDYLEDSLEVVHEDSTYDVGESHNQAALLYDHETKSLAGIRYNADKETTIWFNEKLKSIQSNLDKRYPGKSNRIFDWTSGFEKVLVWSRDDRSGGRILIYLPGDKVIVQTVYPPRINPDLIGSAKTIRIQTRDGKSYEGYLTLPAGYKSGKLPLVVIPHGGPFVRTYYGFDNNVQYLAYKGYAVFEPNFRGSVGYGREHLLAGKGSIHSLMIDDIADGTNWLIANNYANPDQIYIMGFSYGGYASIMSAIRYPNLYKAAASYGSPLDIKAQIKTYKKNDNHFAFEFWNELVIGKDKSKSRLEDLSPIHQMDELKVPLLVFHGEKDDIVEVEQAEEFKEKTKGSALINTTILNNEKHSINLKSNQIYFLEKVLAHFEKAGVNEK